MAEKAFRHAGLTLSEPVLLADMENINQFPLCVLGFTTLTSLKLDQAVFFPGNERHGIWSSPLLETVYVRRRRRPAPAQPAAPAPRTRSPPRPGRSRSPAGRADPQELIGSIEDSDGDPGRPSPAGSPPAQLARQGCHESPRPDRRAAHPEGRGPGRPGRSSPARPSRPARRRPTSPRRPTPTSRSAGSSWARAPGRTGCSSPPTRPPRRPRWWSSTTAGSRSTRASTAPGSSTWSASGRIVIAPRYQRDWSTPPANFLPNGLVAVRDALDVLATSPAHVRPDRSKFALIGHSAGGNLAAQMAAVAAEADLPEPRAVIAIFPGEVLPLAQARPGQRPGLDPPGRRRRREGPGRRRPAGPRDLRRDHGDPPRPEEVRPLPERPPGLPPLPGRPPRPDRRATPASTPATASCPAPRWPRPRSTPSTPPGSGGSPT